MSLDNDDPRFTITFDYDSESGGMRVRLEIVSYVEEIFLMRLRSAVTWIEQALANLPKDSDTDDLPPDERS